MRLRPAVVYHYSVKARDAANNISESSNVVKVETVQVEEDVLTRRAAWHWFLRRKTA